MEYKSKDQSLTRDMGEGYRGKQLMSDFRIF